MKTRMLLATLLLLLNSHCLLAAGGLTLVKEIPLSTAGLPANEPAPRLVPGDVNGDGKLDWVITSGCKVVRVYDHDGAMLWEKVNLSGIYDPQFQKPYYSSVWDLDGDGKCEVIGFQQKAKDILSTPTLTIFDGLTGAIKHEAELFFKPVRPGDHGIRGFTTIAYMRSRTEPDIIVSGDDNCGILQAYDKNLKPLWQKKFCNYSGPKWWENGGGHTMWTYDLNGDGLHELCDGRYIFTGNGRLAVTLDYGQHLDGLACADFDPARKGLELVVCGAAGVVSYNINPETFAATRLWKLDNKALPNPQRMAFGQLDWDTPGLELLIQGKNQAADNSAIVSGRDGRILRRLKKANFFAASIMDLDGDRSEDEVACWLGLVVDKTGRILSDASWFSPNAKWDTWNMAVLPMDVIGDGRDEIVALSRDRLCIGQNTTRLATPPPSFRGERDYLLRFTNYAFSRGCLGFDYRKKPADSAPASSALSTGDDSAPYPPSPMITGVTFRDATARVLAPGSDIWPLTWAADDHQYTCWGDGGGFGGSDKDRRVSFGVARIEGNQDDYAGVNIAGGKDAPHPAPFPGKSEGLLALGDTLYLWLGGSAATRFDYNRLYRSDDHGVTWTDLKVEFSKKSGDFTGPDQGFFAMGFCQFGRGYAGARDNVVYIYAPEIMDRANWDIQKPGKIALIRVDQNQLGRKSAYRFFAGLDAAGQPRWTSDIAARKPVWQDAAGGTHRMAVSYNAPLRRYLLTTISVDRVGRMALYDAPEPWGPWTMAARERNPDRWGSKTILFTFANKWLSADGKRFVIVHTKDDAWASVQGEFTLAAGRSQK